MIQQTVDRLLPMAPASRFLVITNADLQAEIRQQLPQLASDNIIAEPLGRNTAPAIGLAAFLILRTEPHAVLGLFPSDHVVGDEAAFQDVIERGIQIATAGDNIVALGIRPTRPETGYGYIEAGSEAEHGSLRVRRFTEKPDVERATGFLSAGNFYWNSGMFLWTARTLVNALREHLPRTADILERIAATWGSPDFESTLQRLYPECENISIDYAVLEPRSAGGEATARIYCLPAAFGWNDLGSWTALHEHRLAKSNATDGNLLSGKGIFTLDAEGNFIHAPGKFIAAVGVHNLVIVETEDALLITTQERAQDVGKIVKYLDGESLDELV